MSNLAFLSTYAVLQGFWLLGAIAAWRIKMATVRQMRAHNVQKGMPYCWHFGMWNDVVTVHPFIAFMVGLYGQAWVGNWTLFVLLLIFGIGTSWFANYAWTRGTEVIESHNKILRRTDGQQSDAIAMGRMSIVAIIHVPQMAIIMTVLYLSIVWILMGEVPWKLAVGGVCLMLAHAFIGQHWPLRLLKPEWNPWPDQKAAPLFAVLDVLFAAIALFFFFSYLLDRTG